MAVCGGQYCNKRYECEKWEGNVKDSLTYEYIDYSTMGSGGSNQPDIWWCGDKGFYKLFHSVKKDQDENPQKKSTLSIKYGNEEDEKYMKAMFNRIGINTNNEDGTPKSPYRLLGNLAEILCLNL